VSQRHFNPVELRLCWEALPSPERQLADHLLGCEECRTALRLEIERNRSEGEEESPQASDAPGYLAELEDVLNRSADAARAAVPQVVQEQAESAFLLDELWGLPPERWSDYFMAPLPALFLFRVLDEAARVLSTDPGLADTLARLVRLSVLRESGGLPAGTVATGTLARGWAITGAARTRREQWAAADAAFEEASRELSRAPDLGVEAELCRFMADRYLRRNRLTEAYALLEHAARLSGAGGQAAEEIGELNELAQLLSRKGDLEEAVNVLARALFLAEDQGFKASAVQIRLQLTWSLRQLGRRHDALALTPLAVRLAVGSAGHLVFQALAHIHRGDIAQAEGLLHPAAVAALLEGDAPLTALAVLNLVSLYVMEERSASLREMAPHVGLLAEAEAELAPHTRAALAALHDALRTESGSLGMLVHAAAAALDRELGPRPEDDAL